MRQGVIVMSIRVQLELTESVNSISRLAQWPVEWSGIGQWCPQYAGRGASRPITLRHRRQLIDTV